MIVYKLGKNKQKGISCLGWGSEEPEHYFCKGKNSILCAISRACKVIFYIVLTSWE